MFVDFFNSLRGQLVIVELKNNVIFKGKLQFCDNLMNIKLVEINFLNKKDFPQVPPISSAIIRGSSVRYVHLPDEYVDKERDNLGKYSSTLFTLNTFSHCSLRITLTMFIRISI